MLWFRAIEAPQRMMNGWDGEQRWVVCLNETCQLITECFKLLADFGDLLQLWTSLAEGKQKGSRKPTKIADCQT